MGACESLTEKTNSCCGGGNTQTQGDPLLNNTERAPTENNRKTTGSVTAKATSKATSKATVKATTNGETNPNYIFDDEKVSQRFNHYIQEKRKINVVDKKLFDKFDTKSRRFIFGYIRRIEKQLNEQSISRLPQSEETNDSSESSDNEILIPSEIDNTNRNLAAPNSNIAKLPENSMSDSVKSEGFDLDRIMSDVDTNMVHEQTNRNTGNYYKFQRIRIPNNIHYLILLYYYLMENEFENEELDLWKDRANISEFMNTTLKSTRIRMWDKFDKHKRGMLSTEIF